MSKCSFFFSHRSFITKSHGLNKTNNTSKVSFAKYLVILFLKKIFNCIMSLRIFIYIITEINKRAAPCERGGERRRRKFRGGKIYSTNDIFSLSEEKFRGTGCQIWTLLLVQFFFRTPLQTELVFSL